MSLCDHAVRLGRMCAVCGEDVGHGEGVRGGSMLKDIVIDKAHESRVSQQRIDKLLAGRKLILILDLDHTLLHSSHSAFLTYPTHDQFLCNQENVYKYELGDARQHYTSFRPHLNQFLRDMSERFELYGYTKGGRTYADKVVAHMDPTHTLFKRRILTSSEDKGLTKDLREMFPSGHEVVIIIDDNVSRVWGNQLTSLLRCKPYHYFSPTLNNQHTPPPYLLPPFYDTFPDTYLAHTNNYLQHIHQAYFTALEGKPTGTRLQCGEVMRAHRASLLEGYTITCACWLLPSHANGTKLMFQALLRAFGAKTSDTFSENTTLYVVPLLAMPSRTVAQCEARGVPIATIHDLFHTIYYHQPLRITPYRPPMSRSSFPSTYALPLDIWKRIFAYIPEMVPVGKLVCIAWFLMLRGGWRDPGKLRWDLTKREKWMVTESYHCYASPYIAPEPTKREVSVDDDFDSCEESSSTLEESDMEFLLAWEEGGL